MDRREAIRRTTLILGSTLTAPLVSGMLQGCHAGYDLNWKPDFFSESQASMIMDMVNIIIPRTDTPGAVDVGVPAFVESMVRDVYSEELRDKFVTGMKEIDNLSNNEFNKEFNNLLKEEKILFVENMHKKAMEDTSVKRSDHFIIKLKELTLLGFFTSEAGATQVLQYKPVPGSYRGCADLTEVGKTWATD